MKSRHNCKYSTCQPYLGIGPASHACWNGTRFWVPSSVPAFLTRTMQEERLEDPAPCQPSERLMLGMRLTDGVPISWLPPEKTAFLTRCIQAGLLESYQDHIRFTPKGFLVSNTILAELLP